MNYQETHMHSHLTNPKYRPDIDGLRAIAVLAVVGFHAFPNWIKGGFIGVDVFFVISGFLISTIIIDSLERSDFSYAEFYIRRIRRIFPALLLVMFISLVLGWFFLLADEYKQLGKHIAGGAGFISNLILLKESGYFDAESESKPLLHLWSMAIEEQFYILWPLLLVFAWKQKKIVAITVIISLISFLTNIYLINVSSTAAFYLPVTRFWELMIGGIWACIIFSAPTKSNGRHMNLQSVLGFAALVLGFVLINKDRTFPGWWALLPTMSAFLIISAGPKAWINKNILSNKLLVWFGLISFPLYLWHWVIFSFLHIFYGSTPSRNIRIMAILISIVLAWLTYKFIEKPIRFGTQKAKSTLLLIATMTCLLVVGILVNKDFLHPRNSDPSAQRLVAAASDWEYPGKLKEYKWLGEKLYFAEGSKSDVTFLWGDSHVEQYNHRVISLLNGSNKDTKKLSTIFFGTSGGCPPIPHVFTDADVHKPCNKIRNASLDFISQDKVKTVVVGGCWNCYFIDQIQYPKKNPSDFDFYFLKDGNKEYFRNGRGKDLALIELENQLKKLSKDKKVYLLLDNPSGENFNPKSFFTGNRFTQLHVKPISPTFEISIQQWRLREELIELAKRSDIEIIDPVDKLCNKKIV